MPGGSRHDACIVSFMPLALSSNPYADCPDVDAVRLGELYDNNRSTRNQQDLKALQCCSAAALASPTLSHKTVLLGQGEWAWVDVFRPLQAAALQPALLFVHGGRWQLNTSRETAFWAQACVDAGWVFVGLNFPPLSAQAAPELRLPSQVAHVALAVQAVQSQAAALGLDAQALVLAGHSSGAHLALTAALRHPPAQALCGLLLLGGLYDLAPLQATVHQQSLNFSAADIKTCSPLALLHEAMAADRRLALPPTRVAVGAEETSEFIRQSRAVQWALQAHTAAELQIVAGRAHFDAALSFNEADSPLRAFVAEALS
jgi:arylformamidase